jgi:hypothetical protein
LDGTWNSCFRAEQEWERERELFRVALNVRKKSGMIIMIYENISEDISEWKIPEV